MGTLRNWERVASKFENNSPQQSEKLKNSVDVKIQFVSLHRFWGWGGDLIGLTDTPYVVFSS